MRMRNDDDDDELKQERKEKKTKQNLRIKKDQCPDRRGDVMGERGTKHKTVMI